MLASQSMKLQFGTSLLLLAPTISGFAQTSQVSSDSGISTLTVVTKLTVEDVTVTDAKGAPVRGLNESEFTIKEDGKLQPIKNFQEYDSEKPSLQEAPPQLPPNVYTNQQPPAPNTNAVNILLVDAVNTGMADFFETAPINQMRAKQASINFVKTMPSGTQIAILKMGNKINVVQGLTSDRGVLLAALDALRPELVPMASLAPGDRDLLHQCTVAEAQSRMTTDGLDAVAAFASGIKGRKNLIWFTPGTPWLTDYSAFRSVECRADGMSHGHPLANNTEELHRAYGLLTAAQVAVYPIDPRGLKVMEPGGFGEAQCATSIVCEHDSLSGIAKATGGAAYFNRNDLDAAVGEAIATGADYYSLSYVPPLSKYDGKYHRINVQVSRPGLHLQYREGYTSIDLAKPSKLNKTSSAETVPPVNEFHAAMEHGVAGTSQLPFSIRIQPSIAPAINSTVIGTLNSKLKGKPLVQYDFLYMLPANEITLVNDSTEIRKGSVEINIAAFGADGELLNSLSQTANVAVKSDQVTQFMQQPFQLPAQFDLPPGKIFVRVGILDIPSKKMGTLEVPQTVTGP